MNTKVVARFWSKVDKEGPAIVPELGQCWIWTGAKAGKGYGAMVVTRARGRKRMEYGHRLSFEIAHGEHPGARLVCHRCDTAACVRPDHLFLGQAKDNTADMIAKGRMRHPNPAKGSRQHLAKLGEAGVLRAREMRRAGRTYVEIATDLGVAKSTAMAAVKGETWSHVA